MKPALLIAAGLLGGLALGVLAVVGDLAVDGGRLVGALTGRDGLVAACTPALAAKLRLVGFEPRDIDVGAVPTLALAAGRSLRGPFTFQDGAAGARVDGIVACVVDGAAVSVEFRTSGPPVRAT